MNGKVYRDNKYNNKKIRETKKCKKRRLALALGILFIAEGYLISLSVAKAENEPTNNDVQVSTVSNDDANYTTQNNDVSIDNENKALDPFNVGSSPDKKVVVDYLFSPEGQLIYKYAKQYGVDPNIMAAIAMQETSLNHNACIPGGEWYSGYGVGLMQLESPSGEAVTAYNYDTNEWDTEYVTMDAACDLETNIKIGCMMFQNKLKENYGNVFLAIQSHNYGQGMIDMMMAKLYGDNAKAVMQDYSDTSWITEIENIHNNPDMYLPGWAESAYGDGKYLEHVLRFCPSNKAIFMIDEDKYTVGLDTCKLEDKVEYGTKITR